MIRIDSLRGNLGGDVTVNEVHGKRYFDFRLGVSGVFKGDSSKTMWFNVSLKSDAQHDVSFLIKGAYVEVNGWLTLSLVDSSIAKGKVVVGDIVGAFAKSLNP